MFLIHFYDSKHFDWFNHGKLLHELLAVNDVVQMTKGMLIFPYACV